MPIKPSTLLLYGIGILAIGFLSLNTYSSIKTAIPLKDIESFERSKVQNYLTPLDTNGSFTYMWGITEDEVFYDTATNNSHTAGNRKKEKKVRVKKEKNRLCINKKCFRILGVYEKNGQKFVTLSHTKFKGGMRSFKEGEILIDPIKIDRIDHATVSFSNIFQKENGKSWKFDFFDTNITKYKPKDTNETLL